MAVLIAIQSWNEFLYAVILTSSTQKPNASSCHLRFGSPVTDILYGEMCAAAVVALFQFLYLRCQFKSI